MRQTALLSLWLFSLVACGGSGPPTAPDGGGVTPSPDGGAPTAGQMLTITATGRTIPGGAEEEWCEIVQLPNTQAVKAHYVRLTIDEGLSHHAIVQLVTPQSIWNQANPGFQIKGGGCSAPGDDSSPVFIGSQRGDLSFTFPEGVYFPIAAGQKLLLNYHYINTSPSPVTTNIKLEVGHSEGERNIQAGTLFYNWTSFQSIGAGQSSTQSRTCSAFSTPKTLFTLNGHQHQLGTKFEAFLLSGATETKIYENRDWDNPLYEIYSPPIQIAPGDKLKFSCTWQNTTGSSVRFGVTKDDEMCILGGYIWPSDDLTVTCGESP